MLWQEAKQYFVLDQESYEDIKEDWVTRMFKAAEEEECTDKNNSPSPGTRKPNMKKSKAKAKAKSKASQKVGKSSYQHLIKTHKLPSKAAGATPAANDEQLAKAKQAFRETGVGFRGLGFLYMPIWSTCYIYMYVGPLGSI